MRRRLMFDRPIDGFGIRTTDSAARIPAEKPRRQTATSDAERARMRGEAERKRIEAVQARNVAFRQAQENAR